MTAKTFSPISTSLFFQSASALVGWLNAIRLRSALMPRRSLKNRRCYLQLLLRPLLVPARLISPGALLSCELLCR